MLGRVMQYRLEIDVVPVLVGVVSLGVGDGGGFMEVVMVAYWYMWWPHGHSKRPPRFIYDGKIYAAQV